MTRSIRRHLAEKGVGASEGFRWRGGKEISRLEGLSDAVFAFAITLLVVSLEVPRTFDELMVAMRGFFAFALCFALLFAIWYQQYVFFRRYGMEDLFVVWMNAILIFVVLFYVYPLKFLFTGLVNRLLGFPAAHGGIQPLASLDQLTVLMLIFGAGYVAVFLLFALLYGHAYRRREQLELNEIERLDTRESIWSALLQAFVGRGLAPDRRSRRSPERPMGGNRLHGEWAAAGDARNVLGQAAAAREEPDRRRLAAKPQPRVSCWRAPVVRQARRNGRRKRLRRPSVAGLEFLWRRGPGPELDERAGRAGNAAVDELVDERPGRAGRR